MSKISRRDFLKGTAVTGLGFAATTLLGACSNSSTSDTSEPGNNEVVNQIVVTNEVNPQDESYDAYSKDVSAIFSPIQVGPLKLRNRIIKAAAGSDTTPKGSKEMSQNALDYYGMIADGGAALVILETGTLSGFGLTNGTEASEQGIIEGKKMSDRLHQGGALCGVQFGLGTPLSPQTQVNEYTTEEVKAIVKQCGEAAARLKAAGFDMVEMKGATTDVLNQFLSRSRNFREDEYGAQNNENRTRLFKEIIQEIRRQTGDDFGIFTLINAVEENDVNLGNSDTFITVEEAKYLAKVLEEAGADAIQIRVGTPGMEANCYAPDVQHVVYKANGLSGYGTTIDFEKHFGGVLDGSHSGVAAFMPAAAEIKKATSLPVGCAANMDVRLAPDMINKAIADGEIDLVFMNRPLVVDPELPNKLEAGKREEIAPCTKCLFCHSKPVNGEPEKCRVNATTQYAYTDEMPEGYKVLPAEEAKNVMVIGGGPAGMEAARIAAERGHTVTLYEKSNQLGGLLPTVAAYKGNHERFSDLKDYLVHQQEVKGVQIVTDTEVTLDKVKEVNPDVVLVAVGGARESKLTGSDSVNVLSIENFNLNDIKDRVVICGADVQAIDLCSYLLAAGKKVDLINPNTAADIDMGQSIWVRKFTLPHLYAKGVRIFNEAEVKEITNDGVTIVMKNADGLEKTVPCQTVIEAWDFIPNMQLVEELTAAGFDTHAVGCDKPSNILSAIHAGNITARHI